MADNPLASATLVLFVGILAIACRYIHRAWRKRHPLSAEEIARQKKAQETSERILNGPKETVSLKHY